MSLQWNHYSDIIISEIISYSEIITGNHYQYES